MERLDKGCGIPCEECLWTTIGEENPEAGCTNCVHATITEEGKINCFVWQSIQECLKPCTWWLNETGLSTILPADRK